MWSDSETNRDFLNFRCVADAAAELIVQARGVPLSIGVSGGWGAGKSSMLRLISDSLHGREDGGFLFVEFNAWLYQGYDDARAALVEVIAKELVKHGGVTRQGVEKAKALLGRVNWLRVAALAAGSTVALAAGLPPLGLVGALISAGRGLVDGRVGRSDVEAVDTAAKQTTGELADLVGPEKASPPQQIHDLREQFRDALEEMDVTLVVFIDDLDRCLPATAIATLEAIRLFLFLPRTAFVIAADDRMIRHSVRSHFKDLGLDDDLVTNYFDKLVQVPLRVPPLGTQEVRAYLMLLFIEDSALDTAYKASIRQQVCQRLSQSWRGSRVDVRYLLTLIHDCPSELRATLELADRLAPIMTTARQIAGNPRLIKRFLNTLAMRMAIARAQGVSVDEAALAKLLLFERCGSAEAYTQLVGAVNDDDQGRPRFLATWEGQVRKAGEEADLKNPWDDPFCRAWLALEPALADLDLRAAVYVSREHMPIITAADRLSSDALEVLEGLVAMKGRPSPTLVDRIRRLPGGEATLLLDRLLAKARQEQRWGTPDVLWACITLVEADAGLSKTLVSFLGGLPAASLSPEIVPAIKDKPWAGEVLEKWARAPGCPPPVKKAIEAARRGEH